MKKIISIVCILCFCLFLQAKERTLSGTVIDIKGEPVPGAVVQIEGVSGVGTVTDSKGYFSLKADIDDNAQLICSCMGYLEKKVPIGTDSSYTIVLEEDRLLLDEAVVVGYGAMRRSDLTGAVTSVKIDDEVAARSVTLDQMLEGKTAGMQVLTGGGGPDSGINIRIRGLSSFGNSEPLYVVDGIIMNCESEELTTIDKAASPTNGLSGINPRDIASIEILKDASATAIYGSLGANGVVLITTKQANSSRPQISFNGGVSVSQTMKKMDILSFDEYVQYLEANPSSSSTKYLNSLYEGYVGPDDRGRLKVTPMDWQDYCFQTGISQRYYLSIAGKPKSLNYLFSIGFSDKNGIIRTSYARGLSMRLNLEKRINKSLTIGTRNSFGYNVSNLLNGSSNGTATGTSASILRSMMYSRPFSYHDFSQDDSTEEDDDLRYGPERWIQEFENKSERFRINPSLYLNWKIIRYLSFKSTFGGDFKSESRTQTKTFKLSPTDGNVVGVGKVNSVNFNWDNILTFNMNIKKFAITTTMGQTLSRAMKSTELVTGKHLSQPKASAYAINTADPSYSTLSYLEQQSSLLSFFARGIFNYDERYILTATYRFDGSSKFQGKNKWGQFPSFAFAWRPTSERWFRVPVISNMKLRVGWGMVGNQAISSYQTQSTYETSHIGNWMADSGAQKAIRPSNVNNPALKWETSEQYNAGLDLSLWKGRLSLTVDAYNKSTKDLLQQKVVAYSSGFNTIYINDGSICNRGVELTVDSTPIHTKAFDLQIGGNISFNKNIITSVGESGDSGLIYLSEGNQKNVNYWMGDKLQNNGYTNALNIFIEGQPMGLFYGFKTDGIVQEDETGPGFEPEKTRGPGHIRYVDLDGNGYIDLNDRTIIGNPWPKFTYGFNLNFSWKDLSFKMAFSGAYGFDIYNYANMFDYLTNMTDHNIRKRAWTEAWTPENKSNTFPGVGLINSTDDGRFSDRYVEDGSYLRLSNISVSYSLPIKSKKSRVLKNVSFSFSCDNPFVATKYSGWSPFINSSGGNVKRMGVDSNAYPIPRNYNFDVKLVF